jgi:hypothetical protein
MNVPPSSLEIHIHLVTGAVEKFVQDDPQAIQVIFAGLQPQRIFSQPHLMIAGKYSMTVYSCPAITMVELIMEGYPDWSFPLGIDRIEAITEDEFWQRFQPQGGERLVREHPRKVGEPMIGFMEIALVSGECAFVEVHSKVRDMIDQLHVLSQLIAVPNLFSWRKGGGVIFVNPSNILRVTFNPGPSETPTTAWPAHHKKEDEK